jgi:hypothetical protein
LPPGDHHAEAYDPLDGLLVVDGIPAGPHLVEVVEQRGDRGVRSRREHRERPDAPQARAQVRLVEGSQCCLAGRSHGRREPATEL